MAHSVSRGTFWLGLEKAAALVSGVAYSVLLLRWLGPTKFGIMTLALACVGFATAATGNFEMFLERYAAEYDARGQRGTLKRAHLLALAVKTALGAVATVVLLILAPRIAVFFRTPELRTLVPLLAAMVAFDGLATTGRATLYGTQQFRLVSMISMLFHAAKTVMVGLLWWAGATGSLLPPRWQGLPALALGFSLLAIALAALQGSAPLWLLRADADREPAREHERSWRGLSRSMFSYCMPLLGARLTFMSGQNLSKLILGKLFDVQLLGYFTFAYQTIERFYELASTAPSSLLPSFTRLAARGQEAWLRMVLDRAHRVIQALGCLLALAAFVFARELTLFIGSPLFEPAIPILRVLALVPVARTAQQPLVMLFQSLRRPGTVFGLSLVKFLTEFGSYVVLVVPLGIIGAAWSNLAGAVVAYAAALLVLARVLPDGAWERARVALRAAAVVLPIAAIALLVDARLRVVPHRITVVPLLVHAALLLPAGAGVFLAGLVRREDMEKLAVIPLERPWTRVVRGGLLLGLGFFARLADAARARRTIQLGLGIGISVAAVWFSMRGVKVPEVWAALRRSDLRLFAVVMALTLGSFWVRALRWRSLLSGGRTASLDSLYSATMIGFMANNVLPFRLGEFVRAWALARREACSTTMVLATVVVERVVDMLTLIGILGMTMMVHRIEPGSKAAEFTRTGATSLIGLTLALTVFLIVLERIPGLPRRLVERIAARLPEAHRGRVVAALDHFVEGLGLFRDLPRLLWVFLLSFVMFGAFAVAQQVSLEALGIHLPWYAGYVLLVISAFAIMAPAAPGYVGTMNVACVAGLALFGVTNGALANSFSWFYWAGQWLPVTVVGLLYLRREGLSLRSLERAQDVAS